MAVPITVNVPLEVLAAFAGNDRQARQSATEAVTHMVIKRLEAIPNVNPNATDEFVAIHDGKSPLVIWDGVSSRRVPLFDVPGSPLKYDGTIDRAEFARAGVDPRTEVIEVSTACILRPWPHVGLLRIVAPSCGADIQLRPLQRLQLDRS